jgi:hypothetical protein
MQAERTSARALANALRRTLSVNEILMRAVVEAAAFLELSPDDVLDPDIAVKQLESMVYLLGQLSESEKRQLVAFARAEADRVSSGDYRDFLRQFPEAMGSDAETVD